MSPLEVMCQAGGGMVGEPRFGGGSMYVTGRLLREPVPTRPLQAMCQVGGGKVGEPRFEVGPGEGLIHASGRLLRSPVPNDYSQES